MTGAPMLMLARGGEGDSVRANLGNGGQTSATVNHIIEFGLVIQIMVGGR